MDESTSEAGNSPDAVGEQAPGAGDGAAEGSAGANADAGQADVQAPQYEDLSTAAGGNVISHPSLDIVLDVPVTVSLEVGKATMSVGQLIKLGQGAVVELDRAVGEPLDVMVNGALVAHGEIVLVNEKFGIRLTSVVSTKETQEKEAV